MVEYLESEALWLDTEKENENQNKVSVVKNKNKVFPLPSPSDDYYWRLDKIHKKKKKITASVPLDICPVKIAGNSTIQGDIYKRNDDDDGNEEEGEMVPPHLMMMRKRNYLNNQMAFSVCSGNGRTLKGRDLRQVRNSVLRMTGFIETC